MVLASVWYMSRPRKPPRLEVSKRPKRIVFLETLGPRRGLYSILGCDDEISSLPEFIPEMELQNGRKTSGGLVQSKPRYYLYKEVTPPHAAMAQTFHPDQT